MSDAAGFHVYALDHPQHIRRIAVQITRMREEQMLQLASGVAKSFEDYRERIGRLKGLADALALCEDVEEELDTRGRMHAR